MVIRRGLLPAGQRTASSSHGDTPVNALAPKSNSTVNSPLATSAFGTVCRATRQKTAEVEPPGPLPRQDGLMPLPAFQRVNNR